jgi:hypothetical protein
MKSNKDIATHAAALVRLLMKEKHHSVHTKPFYDLLLALAPHLDDIEAEWSAMQPTPALADAYVSHRLAELRTAEKAFEAKRAAVIANNKAVTAKIKALAASL